MKRAWWLFSVFLLLFAADLWLGGPWLAAHRSEAQANIVFLALRVVALPTYAWLLVRFAGGGRGFVLCSATFLAFADLVLLKLVYLAAHGFMGFGTESMTPGLVLMGLMTSYVFFFPGIFLLSFLGTELGMASKGARGPAGAPAGAIPQRS